MVGEITPVLRQKLADDLTHSVMRLIEAEGYVRGDRLPSIAEMARSFGVGHPTLREALRKLETVGAIDIRHGSGVYVAEPAHSLVMSNPIYQGAVSKKLLVDLIEARIPIELKSVALAAGRATAEQLTEMRRLLDDAGESLEDDEVLSVVNMAFHREIAKASDNAVLAQLLDVLSSLFRNEQRTILRIYGSRKKDHAEHLGILEALQQKDEDLAIGRMRAHLEGVREVLLKWNPQELQVA